ncbi:MAG: hypothetical protein HZB26_18085 [Candidatus Hydrogenedentes bacterium]|nr:hypothetical protein [Candidatus Hydrogenedentota bacterium]
MLRLIASGSVCFLLTLSAMAQTRARVVASFPERPNGMQVLAAAPSALLVSRWGGGIRLYDVHDENAPRFAGALDDERLAISATLTRDFVYTVGWMRRSVERDPQGNVLFGLNIIDCADLTKPTILASVALPVGTPQRVTTSGTMAYAFTFDSKAVAPDAETSAGHLYVFDLSDPAKPKVRGRLETQGTASDLYVEGKYLCLPEKQHRIHLDVIATTGSALVVIDVRNPDHPVEIGRMDVSFDTSAVAGNCVYLDSIGDGITVVSVKQPTKPRIIATIPMPRGQRFLAASGQRLFCVGNGPTGGRIQVIDVSHPSHPKTTVTLDLPVNNTIRAVAALSEKSLAVYDDSAKLSFITIE